MLVLLFAVLPAQGSSPRNTDRMVSLRKLFIIDAIGALLSSLSASFVFLYMDRLINLPDGWLGFAVFYPLVIMGFDALSMVMFPGALRHCMKITASMNIFFILAALGAIVLGSNGINFLGFVYLASEILIVSALIAWQLRSIGIDRGSSKR